MNSSFGASSFLASWIIQYGIAIPYRDRTLPPVSRWEVQAAEKRLRAAGHSHVDQALIFGAIDEMRSVEQDSERKTKKARRAREMRHKPPRNPSATPMTPGAIPVAIPQPDLFEDRVEPFEGNVEPKMVMNVDHLSPATRETLDNPIDECIADIQMDSWIPYSQANKILQHLEGLLKTSQMRLSRTILDNGGAARHSQNTEPWRLHRHSANPEETNCLNQYLLIRDAFAAFLDHTG